MPCCSSDRRDDDVWYVHPQALFIDEVLMLLIVSTKSYSEIDTQRLSHPDSVTSVVFIVGVRNH